jgi:hypothetical protein
MIQRARTASDFAVKGMKIVVDFKVTHESGAIETGTFINEASSTDGKEELRESGYLEASFVRRNEIAIVGPYLHPPERIAKARPIAADISHPKVGPFYQADEFGPAREDEIDGRVAECISFNRDLQNSHNDGSDRVDAGEVCFDRDRGVVLRQTTNRQTWFYSDYSDFQGKLLAHKVVFEALPQYRMEGAVQFTALGAGSQADFEPPPDALIMNGHGTARSPN